MHKEQHQKFEWIEYLRAVAIIITVVAHLRDLVSWNPPWITFLYTYGDYWAGVDLFFAISGFVIARDLLRRLDSSPSSSSKWRVFRAFWTRRAFRILPSAWLWLVIGVVAASFFNQNGGFGALQNVLHDAMAAVLQVANIRLWFCMTHNTCGFQVVFWSLSTEEQFYILLPLLALAFGRKLFWPVLGLWIVGMAIPREAIDGTWFNAQDAILVRVMRFDAIAAGVVLAFLERQLQGLRNPFGRRTSIALLIALSISLFVVPPLWRGAEYLMSIPCVMLVWLGATIESRPRPSALQNVMAWIGARSYAIYLIHLVAFSAAKELLLPAMPHSRATELALLSLSAVLTCIFAELNFRIVETPLRELGKRLSKQIERPTGPLSRQIAQGDAL